MNALLNRMCTYKASFVDPAHSIYFVKLFKTSDHKFEETNWKNIWWINKKFRPIQIELNVQCKTRAWDVSRIVRNT